MLEKMKKHAWIWVSLAVLLSAVLVVVVMLWGQVSVGGSQLEIYPTLVNAEGLVEPDSSFTISASSSMDEETLRGMIKLEPEVPYALTQAPTDGMPPDWVLTPGQPLEAGSKVTLRLGTRTQKFDIAKTLLVLRRSPRDGSVNVGNRTGIEYTFNTTDFAEGALREAITISPAVEYNLSIGDGRIAMYLSGELGYGTDYTVTLASSLVSKSGLKLRADDVLHFTTISAFAANRENLFTLRGSRDSYNVLTTEAPIIQASFDEAVLGAGGVAPKLDVNIYSYPTANEYKTAVGDSVLLGEGKNYVPFAPPTDGLTKYASFVAEPFPLEADNAYARGSQMVPFPEALPEGYYLAELCYDTGEKEPGSDTPFVIKRYKLVQSTDLAVYFLHASDNLLLWVNDAATGNAAAGARFTMSGDVVSSTVTTGDDGTVLLEQGSLISNQWSSGGVFTVEWNGKTFVDGSTVGRDYASGPKLDYISTLFTDRPLYKTTDKVQVWGMLRPRKEGTPLPTNVTLTMDGVDPVPVTLSDKGLFTATIELRDLSATYGWINLVVDDQNLSGRSIRIFDYIKPVYTSTIETSQVVYLLSDNATENYIDVNVSTFDGTPVPEWKGELVKGWDTNGISLARNGAFTTAADGSARVAISSFGTTENSWYPQSSSFYLKNTTAEDDNFMNSFYIDYIPRDLMLTGSIKNNNGKVTATINTNRIDTSKVLSRADLYSEPHVTLKGAPVAVKVQATLMSQRYIKKQTGVTYDFINRVSVPTYNYDEIIENEGSFDLATDANGVVVLPNLPTGDEDKSYYLELWAVDSANRVVESRLYLSPWLSYPRMEDPYRYGLSRVMPQGGTDKQYTDARGNLLWENQAYFVDNETVTFRLANNDVPLDKMTGRLLWVTSQVGIDSFSVTDSDTFSIPFSEELLPNYVIAGAYFDGKRVFMLDISHLFFDPVRRELEIKLETPKEEFQPGEQLQINATVTEKVSGKPAADAEVVVAVVDEAIFAMAEQYVNPLTDIYESVYTPSITQYASFMGPQYGGAGEKGGGGGDEPARQHFPDTALFQMLRTDAHGKATTSMTLPDSITSWRITSLALTDNNRAGDTKKNIYATKDFYVMPMHSEELVEGDSFVVGLRGNGKGVASTDPVSYTVTVEGTGVSKSVDVNTAGTREYGWATFDGLAAGDYTVTVGGSCKSFNDKVKLPFTVIKSGLEITRNTTVNLKDGLNIESLRYPVTVTIYDKQYALYNEVMNSVIYSSYGIRTDMRLGRAYTDKLLTRYSSSGYIYSSEPNINELNYSMLKVFPTDERYDMRLTALGYLAVPEILTGCGGSWDNTSATPDDPSQLAAPGAFYLMSANNGNFDITKKHDLSGFSYVDKLDYAIAHALSENPDYAKKVYAELVTPNLASVTGVSGATALYIPDMEGISSQNCTAAASRLATVLNTPDADGLMRYIMERKSRYDPYIMEKLLYLTYKEKAAVANAARITYNMDGMVFNPVLDSNFISLALSRSQLQKLDPKVMSGEVMADVRYTTVPAEADNATKKLEVVKTVTPVNGGEFKTGDLVKITLMPKLGDLATDIGDSEIIIEDYLTSNMRFDRLEPSQERNTVYWWLASQNGQRLKFSAYTKNRRMVPVVYYARNAMPGTYIVEGALVSSSVGDTWGSSERSTITVTP